ncbi:hypothetical protein Tco_0433151 [Tanacetum coccineum]
MKKKDKGWLEFMKQLNLLLRKNRKTLEQELKLVELSKRLQVEERNKYREVDQAKMLQLKRYSFDELKELFETTMKNVNTFVPMETEDRGRASELVAGSSQATITDSTEVRRSVQEQPDEEEKELSKEDLQQMVMVVPVEEVYVEAL